LELHLQLANNSAFHPFGLDKLSSEQLYRCVPVAPSGECSRG